jgi:DNA-directed RNA polymerase specialized sigma24 family protein
MAETLVQLVTDALARRAQAAHQLVELLHPVVEARVARVLWRTKHSTSRNVRQEVEDLTQDVFAFLFEEDGKALRAWDPDRGLSLQNFVGLLAERHAVSVLRSGRRTPFKDLTALDNRDDIQNTEAADPEPAALSRDLLAVLLDRLRLALTPLGMHLFQLLYVEERAPEEVAEAAKMSLDAVYAWRSRLRKIVATLAAELSRTPAPNTIERVGTR